MIITVKPAQNVHFCGSGCGRRLLRSEFLEMKRVKKNVRGRTKQVNQLVLKSRVKLCFHCAKGLKA